MSAPRKNVRRYLKMAGLVLLSLIIATIFIFLVPANIFIWRKWFIAERDLQMGLMVLGLALMVLAYEVYRFIRRSESPWRSIALIVVFVIPVNVLVWVVMLIAEREPSIGFTALGILIILFVFKAYKVYCFVKSAEKPWQILREDLKKSLKILFAFALTIYAYMVLLVALFPTEYGRCDFYNEKLNGGIREYQGRKFKVNLCGTGGDSLQNNDGIRLQVFNEKNDLVALRHFKVDWDASREGRGIHYYPDHLAYVDDSLEHDFNKTITMPPTTLDWIRARIPLLD